MPQVDVTMCVTYEAIGDVIPRNIRLINNAFSISKLYQIDLPEPISVKPAL